MKKRKIKFLIGLIVIFSFILHLGQGLAQNNTQNNESYNCGNGVCDFNETLSCPEDCGDCSLDEDCEDNDPCTINRCNGTPKGCIYTNITSCISGDNCCPSGCDACLDSDCGVCDPCINITCNSYCDGLTRFFNGQCSDGECTYTTDPCNDNNDCTVDTCSEEKCSNEFITKCISGDNCCPSGCKHEQDRDCKTPPPTDSCTRDSGCNDDNPCTEDSCEGKPQMCSYKQSNGCPLGNQCLGYGARRNIDGTDSYCDGSNIWKPQKTDKTLCGDDYECISNKCSDGECIKPAIEPSLIEKILKLLATLIGAFFGIFK